MGDLDTEILIKPHLSLYEPSDSFDTWQSESFKTTIS